MLTGVAALGGATPAWCIRPVVIPIGTMSEAEIDAAQPCATTVARLNLSPAVVVVDFPTLREQGLTLNRVAALVEKAQTPRNRVLDDVALNEAIANCGETVESYYYGHDYKAADLARFFALAAAEHITLNRQELWLAALVRQLGWLAPGANGALITLPAATPPVTEEMRAVILHHEIAHGAYFTEPAYAAYTEAFWNRLSAPERADFQGFLGGQGYDANNLDLMRNETQAYLVFTRDPDFFTAAAVGMTAAEVDGLRGRFIAQMPDIWLKPLAREALPVGQAASVCEARN